MSKPIFSESGRTLPEAMALCYELDDFLRPFFEKHSKEYFIRDLMQLAHGEVQSAGLITILRPKE